MWRKPRPLPTPLGAYLATAIASNRKEAEEYSSVTSFEMMMNVREQTPNGWWWYVEPRQNRRGRSIKRAADWPIGTWMSLTSFFV